MKVSFKQTDTKKDPDIDTSGNMSNLFTRASEMKQLGFDLTTFLAGLW